MKRIFKTLATLTLVVMLLLVSVNGVFASESKAPDSITILCGVAGGTLFAVGAVISQTFRDAGVRSSAAIGGGASNIVSINRYDAELGMTSGVFTPLAREGKEPFTEKCTDVMGIGTIYKNLVHIMVTKASGITSIEQLKGERFAGQPVGQISQLVFKDILSVYGLSEDDLVLLPGSADEGAALVKDRHVVGLTATSGYPSATFYEMATYIPMVMLPIPDEKFKELYKINNGYVSATWPVNTYPGINETIPGVSMDQILIVNRNMPEDEVYWITKTLVENLEEISSAHALLKDLTVEIFVNVGGVELHPGARKYYEENGYL